VGKAILMPKVDYGIHLYGNAPKSSLNKIKTLYHTAIRHTFSAFRTTPINNLLLEANIIPLEFRALHATQKNFKIILNSKHSPIEKMYKNLTKTKKTPKIPSSLYNTIKLCNQLNITLTPITTKKEKTPHWLRSQTITNTSLNSTNKTNTTPIAINKILKKLLIK